MCTRVSTHVSQLRPAFPPSLGQLFLGSSVPRVAHLSPVAFLRDYVAQHRPVIVTGATAHWRAMALWDAAHLRETAGTPGLILAMGLP